jgi:hypothetical protein
VTLTVVNQPISDKVGQVICGTGDSCPPITVLATAFLEQGGSQPLQSVNVSVVAVNNNGAMVKVGGTKTQTTNNNGIAVSGTSRLTRPAATGSSSPER